MDQHARWKHPGDYSRACSQHIPTRGRQIKRGRGGLLAETFFNMLSYPEYNICKLCNVKIPFQKEDVVCNMVEHVKRWHPANYDAFLNLLPCTLSEEDGSTFISDFQIQKRQCVERFSTSGPTSMSVGVEPHKTYSVSEIREADTAYGPQQLWTLTDIDDGSWREIWAPPSLTNLVLERNDSGGLYLSQKKKEKVVTSILIYYLGYTGPLTAPTSYILRFYEKCSK